MIKASDLTEKEVINITDGRSLGFIIDLDVDLERGRINSIVLPDQEKVFGLFGKEQENEISWRNIRKIGEDVILVELKTNIEDNDEYTPEFK